MNQPYPQPFPPQPPYWPQPKKRRVWPWLLLAVPLLLFAGCTAVVAGSRSDRVT